MEITPHGGQADPVRKDYYGITSAAKFAVFKKADGTDQLDLLVFMFGWEHVDIVRHWLEEHGLEDEHFVGAGDVKRRWIGSVDDEDEDDDDDEDNVIVVGDHRFAQDVRWRSDSCAEQPPRGLGREKPSDPAQRESILTQVRTTLIEWLTPDNNPPTE